MNDQELAIAVQESVRSAHLNIPAEQIMHRGRAIRARRRIGALAGGLTAVAVALVLASGLGAGQQGTGRARTAVAAAWTVREAANGTVTIDAPQNTNPAGLQQALRADGVNAIVRVMPSQSCDYATTSDAPPAVQRAVLTVLPQTMTVRIDGETFRLREAVYIIHPDAMPRGSALFLAFVDRGGPNLMTPVGAHRRLPPGLNPYVPGFKPLNPVVLNNDTVPACVPSASVRLTK